MSGGSNFTGCLQPGRSWTALPENGQTLEWSVDSGGDFLQGPLEMSILRGKKVFLNLEPGQVALLTAAGGLQAIFLDGGHVLDVGNRRGQIDPGSSLIFLNIDQPVDLRWTFGSPIDLPGPVRRHVIGNCSLTITGPAGFYRHFIEQAENLDPEAVLDAVEVFTRGALADFLAVACNEGSGDSAGLQSTLMNLRPETLNEDLADCGLACCDLALYTSTPPVESWNEDPDRQETAGHSPQLAHN